jgi:hypothetical protein
MRFVSTGRPRRRYMCYSLSTFPRAGEDKALILV